MEKEKPGYFAIISADVRYDARLSPSEKLLYGEITALANKYGYCWAENRYFAELYNVHKITVSNWLKNLEKQGYIRMELEYIKGTKQVGKRYIFINTPVSEKINTPISENTKEYLNNTSNNNTSNNNKEQSSGDDLSIPKRFEKIWREYPNKKGKQKALSSYKRALKDNVTDEEILEGITRYKEHLRKNDWLHPAHGSTWFQQKRWDDEYESRDELPFGQSNSNDDYDPLSDVR